MKQIDKEKIVNDWQVGLIAVVVGLAITFMLWSLAHISFLFFWLVTVVVTMPFWKQLAERAKKQYPHCGMLDAIFSYLSDPNDWEDDDDEDSMILDD